MKHVFITHSNVTKIVIESIISDLKLLKEEVVIISFRNNVIEGYKNIDLESFREQSKHLFEGGGKRKLLQIPIIYTTLHKIDALLSIKTNFKLYTPQLYNSFFQIIATHKHCKKINIIEEGMSSYLRKGTPQSPSYKLLLFNKLIYRNRLLSPRSFFGVERFQKEEEAMYYILSKQSFNWLSNRKIVHIEGVEKIIPDGAVIFIPDGLVEFNKTTKEDYFRIIKCFIRDNKHNKKVFTKFHPQQSLEIKEMIINEFGKHFQLIIIEPDVIMEKQFLVKRQEKLQLFGCFSSLLFYGQMAGQDTFSYINELKMDKTKSLYLKNQIISLEKIYDEMGIKLL